jgi:hypothetical protein
LSAAPKIDLSRNEKQAAYFNEVMLACAGKSPKRFFAYGGAVRGGKTYVTLFILIVLCRKYPGSRWHVVRKDLPTLKATTIPSFEKLAPALCDIHRDAGNYRASFPNGSQIFFKAENAAQDPELKDFLGLETNGIFIEQAEEATTALWQKAMERAGSWYIDPMPPALTFLTFNPTAEWPKAVFRDPYMEGTLPPAYFYQPALPNDNPFVTDDQWAAWSQMDSRTYAAMIEGDWDAIYDDEGRAFWSFQKALHVQDVPFLPEIPVAHLSFDQNVVPYITMLAAQCRYTDEGGLEIRIFREYCLKSPRNKTLSLCEAFLTDYDALVSRAFYYGDASGNKRDTRAAQSDYQIAHNALRSKVGAKSNRVQRSNPEIRKRVLFLCAIFEGKIPGASILVDKSCENLIKDLLYIKEDANGGKVKKKVTEAGVSFEQLGHTSDALEYLVTTVLSKQFAQFERIIK